MTQNRDEASDSTDRQQVDDTSLQLILATILPNDGATGVNVSFLGGRSSCGGMGIGQLGTVRRGVSG
jgi:hypothetical protein